MLQWANYFLLPQSTGGCEDTLACGCITLISSFINICLLCYCHQNSLCLSLIKTLLPTFRDDMNNAGKSHLKIVTLITSAKSAYHMLHSMFQGIKIWIHLGVLVYHMEYDLHYIPHK
jgi:hypothetical protein